MWRMPGGAQRLLKSVLAATAGVLHVRPHGLTGFVDLDFSQCVDCC